MEEFAKILVESLTAIKDQTSKSAVTSSVNILTFNAKLDDDGAVKWCQEMGNLGTTFDWSDYELLIRGTSGLMGEAREWFSSWKPTEKTWEAFKSEISSMYPPKRNLREKFRRAGLYTSDEADSYCPCNGVQDAAEYCNSRANYKSGWPLSLVCRLRDCLRNPRPLPSKLCPQELTTPMDGRMVPIYVRAGRR
ncbi:hypothetical protein NQ318_010638 [Aromia moschata]|uniref:Retrotransposon gag domain-containing protein n=1 Tax=Aromia moschata TaxID=1265417 RepID=A0AAV8XM15_9CUCU|nr:hypothetical protein NQ318_010638 [Aromia moschata]